MYVNIKNHKYIPLVNTCISVCVYISTRVTCILYSENVWTYKYLICMYIYLHTCMNVFTNVCLCVYRYMYVSFNIIRMYFLNTCRMVSTYWYNILKYIFIFMYICICINFSMYLCVYLSRYIISFCTNILEHINEIILPWVMWFYTQA